jgi:hypothetical protein
MPVSSQDLRDAFDFVSFGAPGENQAFLCIESGEIYYRSDLVGDLDELPDDIDDDEKYIEIPNEKELHLGRRLVFAFLENYFPNDMEEARRIFGKKGAYGRFKDLLVRRGAVEQWYDFKAKAEERALREWCELSSIEVSD